ncbi:MAG TPA: SGNH/GDSL hydrolase family protein [Nitrospira sp.]|nr:SGNH/GDSL hydrolase family protein [Nitrospira sp.]
MITLICGEIFVRIFSPYYTPDTVKKHSLPYVPAAYASSMFAPVNDRIEITLVKAVGAKTYFINEHGSRGASFKLPKPPGVRRIVVLGGSTVFDLNADEGFDWPHLVEKFLKEKSQHQVEVINAGIPGHTSSDSLGRLFTEIWQWEPDYLMIYEAWNDIKYFNSLSYDTPLIRLVKPANPNADPFKNYQGTTDYLLSYSQLYVKIRSRYFAWKHQVGSEGRFKEERRDNVGDLGLAQFRLNLETFVDISRNIHAIPILVTQATLVSPTNTEEDQKKIVYGYVGLSHHGIVQAYEKCRQIILQTAREKNANVLDLMPELQGKSELFHDHDHTTPRGSEEVARRVANFLDPLISQPRER